MITFSLQGTNMQGRTVEMQISDFGDFKLKPICERFPSPNHVQVVWLRATGDELAEIRSQLSGIRMSTSEEVVWTAEDAAFIYNNLRV